MVNSGKPNEHQMLIGISKLVPVVPPILKVVSRIMDKTNMFYYIRAVTYLCMYVRKYVPTYVSMYCKGN